MRSGLNNNTVYDIHCGRKGYVWLATDMGISRYDGFRFRNYPLVSRPDLILRPTIHAVQAFAEDTDGLFYLRLLQGGIVCFDPEEEVYLPVVFEPEFDKRRITSLYITDKHFISIGTADGLYIGTVTRSENDGEDCVTVHLPETPVAKGNISEFGGTGKEHVFACIDRSKVLVYDPVQKKWRCWRGGKKIME